MKHTTNSRLREILRERDFELFSIRHNFDELRDKFLQVERAFSINLRVQRQLENELELLQLSRVPSKLKKNLLTEMEGDNLKARMKIRSSMRKMQAEQDRWKEAFLRQRKITETQKIKHSQSIDSIRDECENILKTCRELGEKHFRELLDLYEESREKVKRYDEDLKAAQARESLTQDRIFELANLFETLEKFDGVRIAILCRRSAEVLRSLATVGAVPYEDELRKLRQVTWDVRENYENNESLEFLQAQNSVLRQVVKSLKGKVEFHRANEESPERIRMNNDPKGDFEDSVRYENEKHEISGTNLLLPIHETEEENEGEEEPVEDVNNAINNEENSKGTEKSRRCTSESLTNFVVETRSTDEITTHGARTSSKQDKQLRKPDSIVKRIYVDAIESHRNGVPYEEYSFSLFDDRQIRIRHCDALAREDSTLILEFVASENDFQEAALDRTVFYLGDRVECIVKVDKSVTQCGVQTSKVKHCEKYVQTTVTARNGKFFGVNAGPAMLNSEKRAIERSLVNLENTLSNLKENALSEARLLIGKDVKKLSNEFFDCVERLKR